MLELPHVAVGAAIATKIPHPIAIPLALGSHFVLDILPHWNPHINREIKAHGKPSRQSMSIITLDSSFALLFGTYIASQSYPDVGKGAIILLSCFAAVLPDVVEAPYFFMGVKSKIIVRWLAFQKSIQNDVAPVWGLLSQAIVILASVWWIFS